MEGIDHLYLTQLLVLLKVFSEKKKGQVNNTSCGAQSKNDRHAVGNCLKRLDVSPSLKSFVHTHHECQFNSK